MLGRKEILYGAAQGAAYPGRGARPAAGWRCPKTAFNTNGLLDGLKKALAERALNTELDHHPAAEESGNCRSGYGRKTVPTDTGKIRSGTTTCGVARSFVIAVLRETGTGSCSVTIVSPCRAGSTPAAMSGSVLLPGRAPYRPAIRSRSEPPRVRRRLFGLSHAAMAGCSRIA